MASSGMFSPCCLNFTLAWARLAGRSTGEIERGRTRHLLPEGEKARRQSPIQALRMPFQVIFHEEEMRK